MGRPSCWSRAAWGAGVGTEDDGASSHPAPHTALASIAGAPRGPHSHPRWTDVTSGTPGAQMEEGRRGEGQSRACLHSDHTQSNDFLLNGSTSRQKAEMIRL